jgi:hypothetical protein
MNDGEKKELSFCLSLCLLCLSMSLSLFSLFFFSLSLYFFVIENIICLFNNEKNKGTKIQEVKQLEP